jgi:hypothetical protein
MLSQAAAAFLLAGTVVACGDGGSSTVSFTLQLSPEFVQGAIPGSVTGVLVTISNDTATDEPVELSAAADGAAVSVAPAAIREEEVAEVTVVVDQATAERPLEIVVTGRRGALESTATRATTVFTWEDDRGVYAEALLDIFTSWLADNVPELGIDPTTEFSGSFVAPGLLVVSHYLFLSDGWELGLAWHVMVPPDDWSEIYLRPRGDPAPTMAFRLQSQAGALDDGVVTIEAVPPPVEVVR